MTKTYEIQISVGQFEYVKCTLGPGERNFGGVKIPVYPTAEEAMAELHEMREAHKNASESPKIMPRNEFNEILELVITGTPINGDPGIIESMSALQKVVLNEVKKLYKRLKDKE